MAVIVVANPKGGVGKSTLATNVAGLLARQGRAVMLGDTDRLQTARQWLALRPPAATRIRGWEQTDHHYVVRPPPGTTDAVLDTPAGMPDSQLDAVLRIADKLLVPLQPSLFDIQATDAFLRTLRAHPRVQGIALALVGMRVREHTLANGQLHRYAASLAVPVIAWLRDTQNYVQLAARGLTLWDVSPGRVERDLEQWQPLKEWILR